MTAPTAESGGVKEQAAGAAATDDRSDHSAPNRGPRVIGSPVHFSTSIFDPPRAA